MLEETVMSSQMQSELEKAIKSDKPQAEIVGLLHHYKEQGISRCEGYSFLEEWHRAAPDTATDDRILEVADFVSGFCAPLMQVWER